MANAQFDLTNAWAQVAASGSTVEIENLTYSASDDATMVYLATGATAPAAGSQGVTLKNCKDGGWPRKYILTANLWARAPNGKATIAVMDGFSYPAVSG